MKFLDYDEISIQEEVPGPSAGYTQMNEARSQHIVCLPSKASHFNIIFTILRVDNYSITN